MSLSINQNVLSMRTYSTLSQTSSRLEKTVEKLSSGLRINRAADDSAGLAISEKMRWQARGLSQAILNAQDGVSMIQSAEGSLNETHSILQRMRELAVQASNDTLTGNDRLEIQKEITQLRDDINRIASNTEFNTKKLLNGSQSAFFSASSASVKGLVTGSAVSGDYQVSLALVRGGIAEMQRSQIFTIAGSGALAQGSTQLASIAQFYDGNGTFALSTPQKLIINGKSKSTEVAVNDQMTLDQLTGAIQNAIVGASGLGIGGSTVNFIGTAQTGVPELGGYFQVTSGIVGQEGHLAFAGNQVLLDALGLSISREAKNNVIEATSRDAFGNFASVTLNNDVASGLLRGMDLKFDSQAAQVAGLGGLEMGLNITVAQSFTIDGGGISSPTTINVVTGYWSMAQIARTVASVNIAGLSASVVDGELRISYSPAAASVNSTITITGASAARTIGISNGSYSGFVQGSKDLNAQVLGISKYADLTTAVTVIFTIGDDDATYAFSAFSTTSVGSTADLVRFADLQASVNETLAANSVSVRLDQSGNSLAFTSLRVGEQTTTAGITPSMVTLGVNNTYAQSKFGLAASATSIGSGDTNFRAHIVTNQPGFQIGADQGQRLNITISNMSASALGIDNLDLTSVKGAQEALTKFNLAIDKVSAERSKLGAYQNRLEYALNNLNTTKSNIVSAESRIRDADIAKEMIEFTRDQILSQSGTAMLAQANMVPQGVLTLLK